MSLSTPEMSAERRKVCLIDDEADVREIYTVALTAEGFDVVAAPDGEAGLHCVRNERPDIVLLDLQMPVSDGFDVLRAIEADKAISRIPIIILSNSDDEEAFRRVGKFNTRFFFIKSLTSPKKVAGAIREVFSS